MAGAHRRWHCAWIWAKSDTEPPRPKMLGGNAEFAPEEHALLRRSFTLDTVPERVPARITADSRYVLWVNGVEMSRGPVRGDPLRLRYDALDLAPHLRAGPNVLAVHARYYGDPTPWWIPVLPSLGLGRRGVLACELDLGNGRWLGSDGDWQAIVPRAWASGERRGISPLPPEIVDGRELPAAWREPDFDDAAWEPAVVITPLSVGGDARVISPPSSPYGPLLPRPIPQLEGETRTPEVLRAWRVEAAPTTEPPPAAVRADKERPLLGERDVARALPIELTGEGTKLVLLDFGQVVSGLVGIDVDAPAGVEIELEVREREGDQGASLDPTSHSTFRYTTRGSDDRFETFDPHGLRYAVLAVRNASEPVTLRRFWCRERLYPVRPGPEFRCSDATLERIYEVGKRSVAINAHDAYLDCPTREQRGWTGDAVVHQMVHLTTNADWGLARWHAEMSHAPRTDGMLAMAAGSDLQNVPTVIPEWPLHWVRSLWNLWRYTGDRELIAGLLPGAENVLRWFLPYLGEHGLICHVPQWVLIDWAALHLSDTSSCLNAQWARALLEFADMSAWLGDAGRATWARERHTGIRDAFELFWDEERGSYVDHAVDGEPRLPMSQHAGATAVWADLVPPDRIDRVLDRITDRSRLVRPMWTEITGQNYMVMGHGEATWDVKNEVVAAQPFYRYVVHDALAHAGRVHEIVSQCRDWNEFLERGETSWPETWTSGTRCHGWGSTPSRDLVMYTLGIQPAEPGFAVARVAPRLGDLAWAEGVAPTPHGPIRVRADAAGVQVESPVPVDLELEGRAPERLAPGSWSRGGG